MNVTIMCAVVCIALTHAVTLLIAREARAAGRNRPAGVHASRAREVYNV